MCSPATSSTATAWGIRAIIASGDVQWMTAGSGIIHQEMPQGDPQGVMDGFQLWANLPKSHKMMAPRYRDVNRRTIPEVVLPNGAKIRIICGRVGEVAGPVQDVVIDPEYLDVTVPPGSEFLHPTRRGHTVFAYVIEGKGYFDEPGPVAAYACAAGPNYFDLERRRCQLRTGFARPLRRTGARCAGGNGATRPSGFLDLGPAAGEPDRLAGPHHRRTCRKVDSTAFLCRGPSSAPRSPSDVRLQSRGELGIWATEEARHGP